jgi:hypothetical protein
LYSSVIAYNLFPKQTSFSIYAVFLPALPPSEHTKTQPFGAILKDPSSKGILTPFS